MLNEATERDGGHLVKLPVFKGNIRFEDVRLQYPDSDRYALDGVSFKVRPGETLGACRMRCLMTGRRGGFGCGH